MVSKKNSSSLDTLPYYVGLLSPVFFFLLLWFVSYLWRNSGYDPVTTGMSELGAVNSPYRHWANFAGFSLLGLSIVYFASHFFKNLPNRKKDIQLSIATACILIGGSALFAVGFYPCDHNCVDITLTSKIHSLLSTVAAIFTSTGIILVAHPLYKLLNKKVGYVSFYLGVLSLLAGPSMFIPGADAYSGLVQRLGLGFSLLWMMYVSYIMLSKKTR